ncbi:mitochondrial DNA-directed RNA polymerase [Scheffersomyces amazonensis]|uniref:mitochondrial DNA-directed RNA polymerase n=1 Tax=Scheffersomyces amazonensis TaxID=1078765 RepID=UPI00315CB806
MKIENQVESLETQLSSIEGANLNLETMKAMKQGAAAMKQIHGEYNVDKVEDTMDDIREQVELADEISEAISRPVGSEYVDEDELDAELAALQEEEAEKEEQVKAPTQKVTPSADKLPTFPTVNKAQPQAAITEDDEDEEALKALQAEMGEGGRQDFPILNNILEDLKSKRVETPSSPNYYQKTFSEIKENHDISDISRKETPWSSGYDPVTRSPLAKDVSHLQSLLDGLLSSGSFERAFRVMSSIYPLLGNPESFIESVNRYLEQWSAQESVSISEVESFLRDMQRKYTIQLNDRTHAIVLSKYMAANGPYQTYLSKFSNQQKRNIFSHVEILGIDDLSKIFEDPTITEQSIPLDLKDTFAEVRNVITNPNTSIKAERAQYFENGEQVPIIEKDADRLMPVDSFGLKVIRHTLLGLKEEGDSEEINKFLTSIESDIQFHVLHNTSEIKNDYFQFFKTLSPQQQEKFNEALDLFNEGRQRQLEIRGADAAREKWKHEYEEMQKRGGLNVSKGLNAQLYQWYMDLLPLIQEEVNKCKELLTNEGIKVKISQEEKKINREREHYAPYLVLVPPEKMCVITILELVKLNSTGGIVGGMRTARALLSVGRAIELEYRSQSLVQSDRKKFSKKLKTTKQWKAMLSKSSQIDDDNEWSKNVLGKVGAALIRPLISVAKVPVIGKNPTTGEEVTGVQAAFHHTYQFLNGQKIGILKIHKKINDQLGSNNFQNSVQPQLLPMLVPPVKWESHNKGGYYYSRTNIVRMKDSNEIMAYMKAAANRGLLTEVYDGLNILGETPWTVNRNVFDVISHFWNTGNEFLSIPPVIVDPEYPPPPPSNAGPKVKLEYERLVKSILHDAASLKSQRCDVNYRLEIARGFLGERIFFPHNIDFRGRAYPISPHFNHLGSDVTRSLFLFWNGKELGESGLKWLKIHLANVYGVDKAPLEGRVKFVEDNLQNVFESAQDPYKPNAWWTKAEKPWQALSVCFELNEAYKLSDPTKYISHIPVHQDGTCNGLQHYAALGGDIEGAKQVNLVPADRPQDVYTYVSKLVQKKLDEEAEAGDETAMKLKDKITRKVVKQTVMTNVYGVTFIGATAQIQKQLEPYFNKEDRESLIHFARYLTTRVFSCIRELFSGAHLIQDWLGESAKRISKSVRIEERVGEVNVSHLSSVIWTTAIGLPCVQPYRSLKSEIIKTKLQDISIIDPSTITQVDARKQQQAFPPNFVHSLDATHMLMTAKACGDLGLAFASVHDSFWTHAADVEIMNSQIRDQFIKLHSNNLIQQLKEEFETRYKDYLQVIHVPIDHPVVQEVKEIRKSIVKKIKRGLTLGDEIHLENQRRKLLASKNPQVVEEGKNMETTISVTEKYDLYSIASGSVGYPLLIPLKFPDIPPRGEFNVETVKDSLYFFS